MSANSVVIVGANLAGGRAAEQLRRSGYDGKVVLVGAEVHRPYERPPLSKKYLRNQHPEDKLFLRPESYYEEQKIELRLGVRARALHTVSREVELSTGERIPFDQLLIATGAGVRRLTCKGADLEGIHYLRDIHDAQKLRTDLAPGKRVVVIGAGVIGAEVAASCREEGLEVVMLEAAPVPLMRAFGEEVGRLYGEFHRQKGVDLRTSESVVELRGNGRVEEVVTASGDRIACDLVVAGIGVSPEVDWLERTDVTLANGVLASEYCETSVAGIYAAGDVANWWHAQLQERIRVEAVDNAQNQAVAAVHNMMGKKTLYCPVPFFWSDQYDLKLQCVGHTVQWDRMVLRGSVESRAFAAFYLSGSQVRAVVGVNRFKEIPVARRLIASQAAVTPEQLADESVPLGSLIPKAE